MRDEINEVDIFAFLDKSEQMRDGLVFGARDEIAKKFKIDKHTATEFVLRYQKFAGERRRHRRV